MRKKQILRSAIPFVLLFVITACGEGTSTLSIPVTETSEAPAPSAANGPQTNLIANVPAERALAGRVADGYIQGATVCVDINENDACDENEPFAISGPGGIYDLRVPAGAENKPIVAAIPADAIDEDTGEVVGSPLVFIAPASRPEFISPITTLVHHEITANPALAIDDAEQVVKDALGVDGAEVSLFDDYIAQSDATENTDAISKQFVYLHNTARVVAGVMKDVGEQVESAATSQGVDVVGDSDTKRAIQEIVRSQVRELLPQIASRVNEFSNSDDVSSNSVGVVDQTESELDVDALTNELRPAIEVDSIASRIEATRDRVENIDTNLQRILADGVYQVSLDCQNTFNNTDAISAPAIDLTSTDSEGSAEYGNSLCETTYRRMQLAVDSETVIAEEYVLNNSLGMWQPLDEELSVTGGKHFYSLIGGDWVATNHGKLEGDIDFLNDSSAIISNAGGRLHIKSVGQDLSGKPVRHHLWNRDAKVDLIDDLDEFFYSGAQAYQLSISQTNQPYILYHQPFSMHEGVSCFELGGNCNVVEYVVANQSVLPSSLNDIKESLIEEASFKISSVFGNDLFLTLSGGINATGSLPTSGRVEFRQSGDYQSENAYVEPVAALPVNSEDIDNDIPSRPVQVVNSADTIELVEMVEPVEPVESVIAVDTIGVLEPIEPPMTEPGQNAELSEVAPVDFSEFEQCIASWVEQNSGSNDEAPEVIDFFAPGEFAGTREELAGLAGNGEESNSLDIDSLEGLEGAALVEALEASQVEHDCVDPREETSNGLFFGENSMARNLVIEPAIVETVLDDRPGSAAASYSRWSIIEVQGVEMIEITLPRSWQVVVGNEVAKTLLLVEHNGFVRVGARVSESRIDSEFIYNESAFITLRSLIEQGVNIGQ